MSKFTSLLVAPTPSDQMTADIVSLPIDVRAGIGVSIQAVYTGTPDGTISLEVTNGNPAALGTEWVEISESSVAISAAGNYMWNTKTAFYGWIRLRYTRTSGAGTISILATVKEGVRA